MKKGILLGTFISVMMFGSVAAQANTIPRVTLNGTKMLLQDSPFIENGSTYVPLRSVAENLGAEVAWDAATQTVTIKQSQNTLVQKVAGTTAEFNGQTIASSAPTLFKDGRVYVPARFIIETLGGEISFNQEENIIDIKYDMPTDAGQKYDFLGRLIRTTDLPANAAEWGYVLQSVPNEMYEQIFEYNKGTWKVTPIEGRHFIKPVNMRTMDEWANDSNYKIWQKLIETNLNLRLNTDYRIVDSQWKENLMNTSYYAYHIDPNFEESLPMMVDDYIQYMKDNHLIIEGDYYVEPSMTYYCGGQLIRTWVKFRINSDVSDRAYLFASSTDYPDEFDTNTWYVGYSDMAVGTSIGGGDGSNLKVVEDNRLSTGSLQKLK